jgi:hypothetical protein
MGGRTCLEIERLYPIGNRRASILILTPKTKLGNRLPKGGRFRGQIGYVSARATLDSVWGCDPGHTPIVAWDATNIMMNLSILKRGIA